MAHKIGSRAGDVLRMDRYLRSIDVVIDFSRFPYHFHDVRIGRGITANFAGLVLARADPICHPECVWQVALLLDIYFRRALVIVEKASADLPAFLYRDILCPLKSAIQKAIQSSYLGAYNAARRCLFQRQADTGT